MQFGKRLKGKGDIMISSEYCKSLHGSTLQEIQARIDERIKSLKGMIGVVKKGPRFAVGKPDKVYESEIKELEIMVEYISGDRLAGTNLTDTEKENYDEIIEKMKQ
jgi:hypothetical protein